MRAVRAMFDTIAPRYDLVNRIMTFRMDVGWRRRAIRALGSAPGSVVLDLACGTGDLCRDLDRAGHRPIGVDLSFGMLAAARTDAPLVHGRRPARCRSPTAPSTASPAASPCATSWRCRRFFAELARVAAPGGRIALLEVAEPPNPVLRWGHRVYFGKVVPVIGGLLSDPAAYRYLPKSVAYLPEPDELLAA